MTGQTIVAIATAPGRGSVGIVRVSGPLAMTIAEAILGRVPTPRRAVYGAMRGADGEVIDEGIALFFPGPKSFTGEDVLEIQGHGGPVVLDLMVGRCLDLGARLAQPGEFTQRAFLNGKLDLAQAEAVADLIDSATTMAARLAARSLQGAFSRRIEDCIESLVSVRSYLEATLDFSDEDIGELEHDRLLEEMATVVSAVRETLDLAAQGERIRDGFRVVIAGPPNAGKSTLLNALAQRDAAIVTEIPGTTRDLVEVDVEVDGLPVRLVDTAGIRHTACPVEMEGVRRARGQLKEADLVLWVYDGLEGVDWTSLPDRDGSVPLALVRNKSDLGLATEGETWDGGLPEIRISALTGDGLLALRSFVKDAAGIRKEVSGSFLARRRHLDALKRALSFLEGAQAELGMGHGVELVAADLGLAQDALGEITGVFTSDDLLGRIFGSFCIGK